MPMQLVYLDEIYKIELETFDDPYSKNYFKNLLRTKSVKFLVSTQPSKKPNSLHEITGYIVISIKTDPLDLSNMKVCDIVSIAVGKEYRGLGIGKALMKHAIQEAKNVGSTLVTLRNYQFFCL